MAGAGSGRGRALKRQTLYHNPFSALLNPLSPLCSLDAILLTARCGIFIHAIKSVTQRRARSASFGRARESGAAEKITGVLRGGKNCAEQRPSVDVHRESPSRRAFGGGGCCCWDQSDGDGVGYGYRGGKTIPTFLCGRLGSEQTRADCAAAELGRPK
jgi:hypothetical protein